MADKNTVELKVKVTDEASGSLAGITRALDELVQHVTGINLGQFAKLGGLATAAYAVGEAFNKVISSTAELESATFRLDRIYNAFSETIGVTRGALADFAEEGARNSRFSSTAIIEMQSTLVKFGSVTGSTLKRAEQAALDLGAQMGDLGSASYIVARALAAPESSERLLRQAGVQLSDSQKALIKSFGDVHDSAGAANIILSELEKRYSGTAKADLDTISGSWEHLKNQLSNLAEQKEGLRGLTDVLNGLARAVGSLQKSAPEQLADLNATLARYGANDQNGPATADLRRRIADLTAEIDKKDTQKLDLGASRGGKRPVASTPGPDEAEKLDELTTGWNQLYNSISATTAKVHAEASDLAAKNSAAELAKSMEGYIDGLQAVYNLQTDIEKNFVDLGKESAKSIEEASKAILGPVTADLNAAAKNAELVHENLVRNMQDVFARFFTNTKGGFRGLLASFGDMLRQMVAQALAAQLTQALIGSSSGGGGLWGAIVGGASAALFGGAGAGTGRTAEMMSLPAGASGGNFSGGLKLVGEEGPEIIATGPARLFNARQLAFAGVGGGGGSMNFAPVTNIVLQPKDGDVNSLRTEFYSAIEMNNKKQKNEIYDTMYRNRLGRMR